MEPTTEQLARWHSPFHALLGVVVEDVGPERVVVRLPVRDVLHQPSGVVHGGVYATLAEGAASIGANVWLLSTGATPAPPGVAVGVSNHTDFLRAVRGGELVAVAQPLHRGRSQQLWEVAITTDDDRPAAHAKVRLANLEGGTA